MKRGVLIAGVVGIVAVFVVGMLASADALPSWVPGVGGKQTVRVRLLGEKINADISDGDACLLGLLNVDSVIVKNADGTIVGSHTIGWGKASTDQGTTVMRCVLDFSINAPKSDFYSVYLDEKLVKTFSRSDAESNVLEVSVD